MSRARLILCSVCAWQLLLSGPVIYCLLSKEWIISTNKEETRGLFEHCRKGNQSCDWNSECTACNSNATDIVCGDFEDDLQGLDREIVGGILATVLLVRGIILFMSVMSIFFGNNSEKEAKDGYPTYVIMIEEFAGVLDGVIVAVYLAHNNTLLVGNPCLSYGAGFWLNIARPAIAFTCLRLIHPCLMYVVRKYSKTPKC